jgi:hypothetical protein
MIFQKEIQRLAIINLTADLHGNVSESLVEERRSIIKLLVHEGVLTLEDPPESGKFFFNQAESQDIYLEAYNNT